MLHAVSVSGILGEVRYCRLARRLDVDDLVLRRAAGGRHHDLLPHLPLQDGPSHGGGVAQLPTRRVRLVGADDLERTLLTLRANDPERYRGTEIDRIVRGLRRVYHPHVAYPALQLADATLQQPLLVLRVVVLGVLRNVPELAGLADAVRNLPAAHVSQVRKFRLEFLQTLRGNKFLVLICHKTRDYKGGLE